MAEIMEQKEILEGNKLIAEFIGMKQGKDFLDFDGRWASDWFDVSGTINGHRNELLLFHCDWNWLMPVIEKIKSLGYVTEISGNRERSFASIGIENTNEYVAKAGYDMEFLKQIDATYYAVIQFINWYNSK
jgi:hypothetical protein